MAEARSHRRTFLLRGGTLVAASAIARHVRAATFGPHRRPQLPEGIAFGDVQGDRASVWARCDRPAQLWVEWDTTDRFRHPRRMRGPAALAARDHTARVDLRGLPADQHIFVRSWFESLDGTGATSEPVAGSFQAAPRKRSHVRVVWSGDTAGQGYGINPDIGGMRGFEAMRERRPDFFIHSGDTIYADGPLPAEKRVEDGKLWRNLVTPAKSKVAETLDEFRGNYRYNLLDANVRRFNAEVPQLWQWDDHECVNNWSSALDLSHNPAYTEKNVAVLAARARRAFLEYAPLRFEGPPDRERLYRHVPYGPLLDVFLIDMRSYRGPNTHNRQDTFAPESAFLGRQQLRWLQAGLARSRATWKLIAADMPIGLLVPDGADGEGRPRFEGISNGDGPALGRELEIAELLRFIKRARVHNVVWITADVHYTAAHYYDPARARFSDFTPFWEFVSGPIHAGAFGPSVPDDTFGLQVVFQKFPTVMNASPLSEYQFFGEIDLDGRDHTLRVTLRDVPGRALFERTLEPQA